VPVDLIANRGISAGVITIHAQPRRSTGSGEGDIVCGALRPSPPANPAITIEVILVEDIDAGPRSRTRAAAASAW
jgi:hypothetical protein